MCIEIPNWAHFLVDGPTDPVKMASVHRVDFTNSWLKIQGGILVSTLFKNHHSFMHTNERNAI